MYRRPRFLEVLIRIREEMAREADYDTDLFAELVRSGRTTGKRTYHTMSEVQAEGGNAPPKKVKSERTRKRK